MEGEAFRLPLCIQRKKGKGFGELKWFQIYSVNNPKPYTLPPREPLKEGKLHPAAIHAPRRRPEVLSGLVKTLQANQAELPPKLWFRIQGLGFGAFLLLCGSLPSMLIGCICAARC